MSHVATIDLEIRDLDALSDACNKLGLELVRGQQDYRWYGKSDGDDPLPEGYTAEELGKCEHAIRIPVASLKPGDPEPYEVGVVRRRDGRPGFQLMWDFFAGGYGMLARVGPGCQNIKREYATAVARRQAVRQGFLVQENRLPDGSVQLKLVKHG